MNITLTLGWWMIPAFLPALFFVYASVCFLSDSDKTRSWWAIWIGAFIAIQNLLTRYL